MGDLNCGSWLNKIGRKRAFRTFFLSGVALLVLFYFPPRGAAAQSNRPPPSSTHFVAHHSAKFQKELRFGIDFINEPAVEKVTLYLQAPNFRNSYRVDFQIDAAPGSHIEFNHVIDLVAVAVDPFATLTYWWTLEGENGDLFESDPVQFVYEDDRYSWEKKSTADLTVYWTTGQGEIGQIALEIGAETLPEMEQFFNTTIDEPVAIYIYPSTAALQSIYDSEWIGGVATPRGNRLFLPAANPRTAGVDFRRQIPHELSHLFFAQLDPSQAQPTPKWLDEGLAVYFEDPPNSSYAPILQNAFDEQSTIPFELLCSRFPTQSTDQILLAYAQSGSLINFIEQKFGRQQLSGLIQGVEQGLACDQLVEAILDVPLEQLQGDWLAAAVPESSEPQFTFWNPTILWMILFFAGFGLMGLLAIGSIREV